MELSDEKYFEFLEMNHIMTKNQAKDIIERLKNNESFYYIKKNTNINKFKIEKYILPFVSNYQRSISCRYKYSDNSVTT
jgi:Zn/Cd-binding protein ZinT